MRSACLGQRQRSMRSGPGSPRSAAEGKPAKKGAKGDERVFKELKEIAAVLKGMKSSRGVGPRNTGKFEHDSTAQLASRQASHAEEDSGAARCSQQDTARAEHLHTAAYTGSVVPSHPDSGSNQQATASGTKQSRHEHSGQLAEGDGHSPGQDGQAGQAVAKQGRHKAAVDKGVQAAPTAHRVPVQAVLLTPTAPVRQVSLMAPCAQCYL